MKLDEQVDRRGFLKRVGQAAASGLASAGLAAASGAIAAGGAPRRAFAAGAEAAGASKPALRPGQLRKSLKLSMVEERGALLDKFKMLREIGFEGVEIDWPNNLDRAEVLTARDQSGLIINGVVNGAWKEPLSHPDAAVRKRAVAALQGALREAKAYGADSVLLVPAVVGKEVAYDEAYLRSQAEIRKVLPLAEELGVVIAIEDVWNNFLLSPLETARYVDEFNSPMLRVHFDVGNVVRNGWPEQWIRILGKRIARLDVKEYSRKKQQEEGLWKGFNVELGDGDCDWPAVMKALRAIGYSGWAAAEVPGGGRERLAEISRRMDRIFAA